MSSFRAVDVKTPASLSAGGVRKRVSRDVRWCSYLMALRIGQPWLAPRYFSDIFPDTFLGQSRLFVKHL